MPTIAAPDFLPALPEIALACAAMALLLIGVFRGEGSTRLVSWLSVLVLIGILLLAARLGVDRRVGFYGMFITDAFALFMKVLVLVGSAVSIVMSIRFNEDHEIGRFHQRTQLPLGQKSAEPDLLGQSQSPRQSLHFASQRIVADDIDLEAHPRALEERECSQLARDP